MFRLFIAVTMVSFVLTGLMAARYFNGHPHRVSSGVVAPEVCENQGSVVTVYSDDDAPIWHVTCSSGMVFTVAK